MNVLTVDFETYYDQDYSLSNITTEAYIRSDLFEVIGVSVKDNDKPPGWYSGSDVAGYLAQYDFANSAVLCHNTVFDGAIMSWRFGIKPRLWLDTLSMARPLHGIAVAKSLDALTTLYQLGQKGDEVINAKGKRRDDFDPSDLLRYAAYCMNDVELTHKLFRRMARGFRTTELMLIDRTIRMFTEPTIELDLPVLEAHLTDVLNKKSNLLETMGLSNLEPGVPMPTEAEAKSILMSNDKLAAYLRVRGVEPPTKQSPKTGKTAYAFAKTDKAFTALLEHDDPIIANTVAARLGVKSTIEESRTKSLIEVAKRGALPIMLNYYGAHTGRFSGGDKMNLQNLPRGGALRRSLKAPKGKLIVSCDSSQIEARTLAWLAGQDDLVEAFREGRDIYSEFATDVYGEVVTKADKPRRFVGKTSILGLGYGMGGVKLQRTLELGNGGVSVKLEIEEAARVVSMYRGKYWKIPALWGACSGALEHMITGGSGRIAHDIVFERNTIGLPSGFNLRYDALRTLTRDGQNETVYINDARQLRELVKRTMTQQSVDDLTWIRLYGGKMVENIVQALARIVVAEQLVKISQHYHVALQVHDEVVVVVPEDEAQEAKALMEATMRTPPVWALDLPVDCEADIGDNYGAAH